MWSLVLLLLSCIHSVIYLCKLTGIWVQINWILGMNQLKSEYELTGYELTWVPHNQFLCITLVPPRVLSLWLWPQGLQLRGSPQQGARHIGAVQTLKEWKFCPQVILPSYLASYFRMSLYWFMAYRTKNVTFEACLFCFMAYTFVERGTIYLERAKRLESRGVSNRGKMT